MVPSRLSSRLRAIGLIAVAVALAAAAGSAQSSPPERFSVQSDGHPMAVWARRPATPRGVVLLVHGRTWSSRPDFDLQVPGLKRSVMMSLAAQGFAAFAVDMRGYGETPRDATGWLTPKRAAADLANVLVWVGQQYPALPKPTLIGWSRGGAVSMLTAQMFPARMSALVLFGFAFDPGLTFGDSTYPDKPPMVKNSAAGAASDFVAPKVTPQAVIDAFVAQALRSDPISADVKNDGELSVLAPQKLAVPTLLLYGERDINVTAPDGAKFFQKIAAADKQMIQLPGADHAAQLEDTHDAWIAAVTNFITRPPARR